MQKILIAFFSQPGEIYNVGTVDVGNTEIMAQHIAEILREEGKEVDLFKIEPTVPYPLEYQPLIELAQTELAENARPSFKGEIPDASKYDAIFVGYPIWWGELPMIVYSAIDRLTLDGKVVVPFNTHEGSGDAGTHRILKEKLSNADVRPGLAIAGRAAREETSKEHIKDWLKEVL